MSHFGISGLEVILASSPLVVLCVGYFRKWCGWGGGDYDHDSDSDSEIEYKPHIKVKKNEGGRGNIYHLLLPIPFFQPPHPFPHCPHPLLPPLLIRFSSSPHVLKVTHPQSTITMNTLRLVLLPIFTLLLVSRSSFSHPLSSPKLSFLIPR